MSTATAGANAELAALRVAEADYQRNLAELAALCKTATAWDYHRYSNAMNRVEADWIATTDRRKALEGERA